MFLEMRKPLLFRILYQAVTKDIQINLTEQILQLLVDIWKIIVNNFRGAAALMIDHSMKAFHGDPDGIDTNISYSQTDPQTARFAESFKVKRKSEKDKYKSVRYRRFTNESKMNIIVCLKQLLPMVR